ncbi:MAG: hypothetical protein KJI69_03310 [Patescibacteria group bacterium]|nr:hypothetical protein [Patescibacteria group bacterium]
MKQYHSVEEILELYSNKDALEVIEIMMEKEVLRSLKEMENSPSDLHGLVEASNAGYVSGIMWVRNELAKVNEALKK